MDNDHNDYQGQNHIVGEESLKVSSVLRPYALPRFDFDDTLPGHLRYDSLVESEVFLGIPSQEDNHWIEDFSRGSSGIEFRSSAAESCSIARRKNVWSEATSSESVEMLLKSVGQDEMVPGESIVKEPDACDELGSLAKQMELNLRQDEKRDDQSSNQALQEVELSGNISELNQTSVGVDIDVKCTLETQQIKQSDFECSGTNIEKSSLVLTEENTPADVKCDDKNQQNPESSSNVFPNNSMRETSVVEEMQIITECFTKNISKDVENLSNKEKGGIQTFESGTNPKVKLCEDMEEQISQKNDSSVNIESLNTSLAEVCTSHVTSKMEATQNFEDCSISTQREGAALGHILAMHSAAQTSQNSVVSQTMDIKQQSMAKCEKSSGSSQCVGSIDRHAPASSEVETHVVGFPSSSGTLSSADFVAEKPAIEMSKETIDPAGVQEEAELPSVPAGVQNSVENCSINKVDTINRENKDLRDVDSESVGSDNDPQRCSSSSLDEVRKTVEVAHGLELGSPSIVESVSRAGDVTNLASHETSDHIPSLLLSDATADEDTVRIEEQKSPSDIVSIDIDKKDKIGDEVLSEAHIPNFKGCSPVEDKAGPICETEKNVARGVASGVVITAHQSIPAVETSDIEQGERVRVDLETTKECSDKMQLDPVPCGFRRGVAEDTEAVADEKHQDRRVVVDLESSEECPDKMQVDHEPQVDLVPCGPKLGQAEDAEAVAVEKHQEKRVMIDLETSKDCFNKMQEDPVPYGSKLGEADDPGAVAVKKHHEIKRIANTRGAEHSEVSEGDCLAETEKPSHDSSATVSSKTEKREQERPMEAGIVNIIGGGSSYEVEGKGSKASREERSFTFDVTPLAGLSEGGETCMRWQSFPNIKACKLSTSKKGSAVTSSSIQIDHEAVQEISQTVPLAPEGVSPSGGPKSTSQRKPRRGSIKAGKDIAKRGSNVKELASVGKSERKGKLCLPVSPSGSVQIMQYEVGSTERSGTKSIAVLPILTSNLPDLNTSVPTSVLFNQPFTDSQQVQLRAQIYVYGSMIQGAAPDEACMVSAFGTSGGGRSVWEPAWRACVEKLHGQKSIGNNYDTPMRSHSDSKAQDQSGKQGLPQSKVVPSAASRLSSKDNQSPIVNSMIPLSSPLWNISTPSCNGLPSSTVARGALLDYQAPSPMHPYQTPPMRSYGGHTTSWLSQPPFPSHWVASPQSSAIDFSARLSPLPTTETLKLAPIKDPSVIVSSGKSHGFDNPIAQGGGTSTYAGSSLVHDGKKMIGSIHHSVEPKSRKRKKSNTTKDAVQNPLAFTLAGSVSSPVISHSSKKSPAIEDPVSTSLLARNQTELVSTPIIGSHYSTSVTVTASPTIVPSISSDKFPLVVSPALSSDLSKRGTSVMKKIAINAEDFSKVEVAKVQAEEASAAAALAVSCCQSLWTQLGNQRNSGLISDVDAKLSSAAAAIAAAASVAKAAAAAAKIALSAALQAKQMADEALSLNGTEDPAINGASSSPKVMNSFGSTAPSILKGTDGSSSSNSIIFAAREAARRRVEAASAASRHAENLDAIVKAAELAAEAVSQAGVVVGMDEPLPMNVLVEAGPDHYWKRSEVLSKEVLEFNTENGEKRNVESLQDVPKQPKGPSAEEMSTTNQGRPPRPREISRYMVDNVRMNEDTSSLIGGKKDFSMQKGRQASDLAEAITNITESEKGPVHHVDESEARMYNGIKEGCLVEVFKEGGHFKGAWYSANVLSMDDGKALVCYTELQSDEVPGLLREWVPLEGEGNEVPFVRIPHPMSSMGFEGTKKRRRAALRDYNWSVGDRVDAWIEDCWREGVIMETHKTDEATLTVHFPAQGETSNIKAWHLRPTRMWTNGEWIELPTSRETSQGDTPQDKRQKRGSPAIVEFRKDEEPKPLPLSSSEKVFNLGSNRDERKAEAPRTMRSGLQKEGSKVIFGVPKPGKKTKFMDVSKHYVSERESTKNAMPQRLVSRTWNNSAKLDSKEKQAGESKSGKFPGVSSRTLPQRGSSLISSAHETTFRSFMVKDSINDAKNISGRRNLIASGPVFNSEEAVEVSTSSRALPADRTKKRSKPEQLIKGKVTTAGGSSTKSELKNKPTPEVSEPRRSNRRIQPTSRLLEGLQSSLTISKIPSVSHDKINRSHNGAASRVDRDR